MMAIPAREDTTTTLNDIHEGQTDLDGPDTEIADYACESYENMNRTY